jgi:hypothetical protein
MQPYFFPYIGYFQLLASADQIVFLDDVNFINKGWIHRNRVNVNGQDVMLTVPLVGKSQNKMINEIPVLAEENWKKKLLQTLEQTYTKAPNLDTVLKVVTKTLEFSTIGEMNIAGIENCFKFAGIEIRFVKSSDINLPEGVKGTERIKAICRHFRATEYINPPGGRELYDKQEFLNSDLQLKFLSPRLEPYFHAANWLPGMSILDAMMFCKSSDLRQQILNGEVLNA